MIDIRDEREIRRRLDMRLLPEDCARLDALALVEGKSVSGVVRDMVRERHARYPDLSAPRLHPDRETLPLDAA